MYFNVSIVMSIATKTLSLWGSWQIIDVTQRDIIKLDVFSCCFVLIQKAVLVYKYKD